MAAGASRAAFLLLGRPSRCLSPQLGPNWPPIGPLLALRWAQGSFAAGRIVPSPIPPDILLTQEEEDHMSTVKTSTLTAPGPVPSPVPVPGHALVRRPAAARGMADHGWLKSAHSFSFASYHDPQFMHFEALRVINDDWIAGGGGFPTHPHADFEIFSYVLDGAISHEDSMGNGSTVAAGGIQYMTAGTGVRHSEFNPSADDPMRLLQIWLMPKTRGAPPKYEVRHLSPAEKAGRLALFISEDGRDGSIQTLAPAEVYAGTFDGDQAARLTLNKKGWVQVARGQISVNGLLLAEGDGLAITAPGEVHFAEGVGAEILVFDLDHFPLPSA